jgi:hypothetical protein
MRWLVPFLLLLLFITGCSKKKSERTNFFELNVQGNKFTFNKFNVVFDTTYLHWEFQIDDTTTNSYVTLDLRGGTKWINGEYTNPPDIVSGREISNLTLQTYVNRYPGTYFLANNPFSVTIDRSENGRIHGTFYGKMTCSNCVPYGLIVNITNGEFELPYIVR